MSTFTLNSRYCIIHYKRICSVTSLTLSDVSPTGTNVIRAIRVLLSSRIRRMGLLSQHITNLRAKSLNNRQFRDYCQWKVGYGEF